MGDEFVVDTHALIWFLEGNPRLGTRARSVLEDANSVLYLPVIALAEACWIVDRGRTGIPSVANLLADIHADSRVVIVPLDHLIVERSLSLSVITEMHDRLIVATALHLGGSRNSALPILTVDGNITAAALCPVVW